MNTADCFSSLREVEGPGGGGGEEKKISFFFDSPRKTINLHIMAAFPIQDLSIELQDNCVQRLLGRLILD
jgi:hypothetical protein